MQTLPRWILFAVTGLMSSSTSRAGTEQRIQEAPGRSADAAVSSKSGYALLNGIRIRYLEWGRSGPPVVLLHGLYDDAGVWEAMASRLAVDCHIVAPDRRGAGSSDKRSDGYNSQTLIGDLTALLRNLKIGPVTLVGHSAGAEIALMMAAQWPEMIHSVVMVDGGFWPKKANSGYDPETLYPRVSCPVLLIVARRPRPGESELAEYRRLGRDYFKEVERGEQHATEVADRKLRRGRMVLIKDTSHWIQKDQHQALAETIKQFLLRQ